VSPRRALPPALYRKFPFLQEVLDGMSASVKVVDQAFHVVWANKRAIEESGHDLPTLRGRPCHQYLGGFKQNCPWCPVVKAFREGGLHVGWFRRSRDGEERPMEVTGYLLPTSPKGVRYAVEITREATPDLPEKDIRGEEPPAGSEGPLGEAVASAEKAYLVRLLRTKKGDLHKAASIAAVSEKTLRRRLRLYDLRIQAVPPAG